MTEGVREYDGLTGHRAAVCRFYSTLRPHSKLNSNAGFYLVAEALYCPFSGTREVRSP